MRGTDCYRGRQIGRRASNRSEGNRALLPATRPGRPPQSDRQERERQAIPGRSKSPAEYCAETRNKYSEIRKKDPKIDVQKLTLRLVKYQIGDNAYTLGTTLLDKNIYPVSELAKRYHERWDIEELYKMSKVLIQVQDFHGQSERGVKQELYAHFVILTLSRIFSNHVEQGINNGRQGASLERTNLNMKNCLVTLSRHIESLFLQHSVMLRKTLGVIVNSMITCRQRVRPNRTFRRLSKKPFSKWQPAKKAKDPIIPAPIVATVYSPCSG